MSKSGRRIQVPTFKVPQAWLSNKRKLAQLAVELSLLLFRFDNTIDGFVCFTDPVVWQLRAISRDGETGFSHSRPMRTIHTSPALIIHPYHIYFIFCCLGLCIYNRVTITTGFLFPSLSICALAVSHRSCGISFQGYVSKRVRSRSI